MSRIFKISGTLIVIIYAAESAAAFYNLTSSVLWLVSICNEFVLILKYIVMKKLWNMSII